MAFRWEIEHPRKRNADLDPALGRRKVGESEIERSVADARRVFV
jgi:hypothetical protein